MNELDSNPLYDLNPLFNYKHYSDQIAKMEKMVTSFNDFQNQTQSLDANHQAQVDDLNTIIQALFENPGTFTGSAATKLQEVVNDYLQKEHSFTGYPGDTSSRLSTATHHCQTAAKNIEADLQTLYKDASAYADKLATLSSDNFFQRHWTYFVDGSPLVGGDSSVSWEESSDLKAYEQDKCFLPPQTRQLVPQMETEQRTWEGNMDTLAKTTLPALPPSPTDPVPFKADPGSLLYPTNEQSFNDSMAEELAKQYGVPLSDVQDIIHNNPGLSAREYALLVEYFKRTGRKPYNVRGVAGVGTRKKGGPGRIIFVTQGDIDHIRDSRQKDGTRDFSSLSDKQLADLLIQNIQRNPDKLSEDGTSTRYDYVDMDIGGRKGTLAIVVSDDDPGRIVTSFIIPKEK